MTVGYDSLPPSQFFFGCEDIDAPLRKEVCCVNWALSARGRLSFRRSEVRRASLFGRIFLIFAGEVLLISGASMVWVGQSFLNDYQTLFPFLLPIRRTTSFHFLTMRGRAGGGEPGAGWKASLFSPGGAPILHLGRFIPPLNPNPPPLRKSFG